MHEVQCMHCSFFDSGTSNVYASIIPHGQNFTHNEHFSHNEASPTMAGTAKFTRSSL
nr:hypothetical protein [Anaerobiospirillum thomasii]